MDKVPLWLVYVVRGALVSVELDSQSVAYAQHSSSGLLAPSSTEFQLLPESSMPIKTEGPCNGRSAAWFVFVCFASRLQAPLQS